MPSLTIENYLKAIYSISARQDDEPAATGQIATVLSVSPGTVTSMLKTLSSGGMVTYTPYEGVLLTEAGKVIALRVLRRHRLIELFLTKTLNLSWDEVHEEAENMEHAVSDLLIDRIDEFLSHPTTDPHGDPIPRADGTLPKATSVRLSDFPEGKQFRLVRVLDQSPEFLRYLSEIGLSIGASGTVEARRPEVGILSLVIDSENASIGIEAAEKLKVKICI